MKIWPILSIILAGLLNTACATVTRGPNVKFHVVTDPPGATVTTDLERKYPKVGESKYHECSPTPCYIHVSRRAEFKTFVDMEDHHPAIVEITSGFGRGGAATGVSGTAVVAAATYGSVYTLATAATIVPAAIFGTSASTGAAAGAVQAASGVGAAFLGLDLVSGAMLDVKPNPLILVMIPEEQPLPEDTYIDTDEELYELLESVGRKPSEQAEHTSGRATN